MVLFDKHLGETPLEALNRLRTEQPELQKERLAYAGRLDPMASGLLLVLVGEECKQRDHYQGLDKTYEFGILTGVETDTYDILGLVTGRAEQATLEQISKVIHNFPRSYRQSYPPYSSKTIGGRKLFELAREGKLEGSELPKKMVEIKELSIMRHMLSKGYELLAQFEEKIDLVTGDFRQEEIKRGWREFFAGREQEEFQIVACSATVSSGTYIRSLVHDIGRKLGCGAIALDIHRTRVGAYIMKNAKSDY